MIGNQEVAIPIRSQPVAKPIQAARIFAALGDPTRLSLLIVLRSGGTRSIARLTANLGMSRQAVTKHLQALQNVGLVAVERVGRETHYVYLPEALETARRYIDAIDGRWDVAVRTAGAPTTSSGPGS